MSDPILTPTLGVVVGQTTSGPRNRPVGEGRGLLAQRYGRYVAGSAGHRDRTPPALAATLVQRYSNPATSSSIRSLGPQQCSSKPSTPAVTGWGWTSRRAGQRGPRQPRPRR